jgi:antitoxin HicB
MGFDVSEGANHTKVTLNGRGSLIGRHPSDLKTGTFRGILKQLGLKPSDLEDWTMRYAYPYDAEPQPEGGWTVTFPDVPEAITQGDTPEDVEAMAEDALVTALSFYTGDSKPLPRPSPAHNRPLAIVPPLVAAKLALHDAMLAGGVSNIALGRRLNLEEKAVRRLRDPLHRSHIGAVEAALRLLGQRLVVDVAKIA